MYNFILWLCRGLASHSIYLLVKCLRWTANWWGRRIFLEYLVHLKKFPLSLGTIPPSPLSLPLSPLPHTGIKAPSEFKHRVTSLACSTCFPSSEWLVMGPSKGMWKHWLRNCGFKQPITLLCTSMSILARSLFFELLRTTESSSEMKGKTTSFVYQLCPLWKSGPTTRQTSFPLMIICVDVWVAGVAVEESYKIT